MLSKRQLKYFKSLQLKKNRQAERKFLVEGAKGTEELLKSSLKTEAIIVTEEYLDQLNPSLLNNVEVIIAKERELTQIGTFRSNNTVIGVAEMTNQVDVELIKDDIILLIDSVNDPGNLGTIIRVADWYGLKNIICSLDTTDVYNPKVINSTVGSFTRVGVHYTDLVSYLEKCNSKVYGALLEGNSIYETELGKGVILMGSESHGISDDLIPFITQPIRVPRRGGAESLNVGVATAVVLDNFFRS